MTKFLEKYRGAALYEIENFQPSDGEKLQSKVIARAKLPERRNMMVDFKKEAASQDRAIQKVRESIDRYLEEHELDEFATDSLNR